MKRTSPFTSPQMMIRVFAKALILLLILNVLCLSAQIDPIRTLTTLNTWAIVGHGRARLIYPSDLPNGQLAIEALLATHQLAHTPKSPDEYRVIVLGESGIAGWGLTDQETFTAQLTARKVRLNGKHLIAYNLAYPSPDAPRDMLILDAALRYQPDLVIWFVTASTLDNSPHKAGTNNVFYDLNRARLQRLTTAYDLEAWFTARLAEVPAWQSWIAIHNQDTIPVWLNSLLYPFVTPDFGLTTRRVGREPIPAKARHTVGDAGFTPIPNDTWRFLRVGQDLAANTGARLLVVNEAMLIGSGKNSETNYNEQYNRAFYDNYRQTLGIYAAQNHLWYADLWNVIPAEKFTDTPFHADLSGYALLVDHIVHVLAEDRVF
jgi:hypothetical protein